MHIRQFLQLIAIQKHDNIEVIYNKKLFIQLTPDGRPQVQ